MIFLISSLSCKFSSSFTAFGFVCCAVGDVIRDETADIIVFSETIIKDIDNYSDMGDVMRLDVGAVVPSVADENRVIENLTSILDKKIVECIQTLSRRSFTKHIVVLRDRRGHPHAQVPLSIISP